MMQKTLPTVLASAVLGIVLVTPNPVLAFGPPPFVPGFGGPPPGLGFGGPRPGFGGPAGLAQGGGPFASMAGRPMQGGSARFPYGRPTAKIFGHSDSYGQRRFGQGGSAYRNDRYGQGYGRYGRGYGRAAAYAYGTAAGFADGAYQSYDPEGCSAYAYDQQGYGRGCD